MFIHLSIAKNVIINTLWLNGTTNKLHKNTISYGTFFEINYEQDAASIIFFKTLQLVIKLSTKHSAFNLIMYLNLMKIFDHS